MIIPDYNKGTVNVHMKLSEKDASLTNEAIAAKAFICMTGLKPVDKITETSWPDVQYQVFQLPYCVLQLLGLTTPEIFRVHQAVFQ